MTQLQTTIRSNPLNPPHRPENGIGDPITPEARFRTGEAPNAVVGTTQAGIQGQQDLTAPMNDVPMASPEKSAQRGGTGRDRIGHIESDPDAHLPEQITAMDKAR